MNNNNFGMHHRHRKCCFDLPSGPQCSTSRWLPVPHQHFQYTTCRMHSRFDSVIMREWNGWRIHINITIPTDNSVRTAVLPHWVSLCLNLKFVPQARFQIAISSDLFRRSNPYGYSQQVRVWQKGGVIRHSAFLLRHSEWAVAPKNPHSRAFMDSSPTRGSEWR